MNGQCFVGSAVLNSINYETLRKMGMGICRAEDSVTLMRGCHHWSPLRMRYSREVVYLVPFTSARGSGVLIRIARVRMSEMEGKVILDMKLN